MQFKKFKFEIVRYQVFSKHGVHECSNSYTVFVKRFLHNKSRKGGLLDRPSFQKKENYTQCSPAKTQNLCFDITRTLRAVRKQYSQNSTTSVTKSLVLDQKTSRDGNDDILPAVGMIVMVSQPTALYLV